MAQKALAESLFGHVEDLDPLKGGIVSRKSSSGKSYHSFVFTEEGEFDARVDVYGEGFVQIHLGLPWMSGKKSRLRPMPAAAAATTILDIIGHDLGNIMDGRFSSEEAYIKATSK
jgi:hypothetical protein